MKRRRFLKLLGALGATPFAAAPLAASPLFARPLGGAAPWTQCAYDALVVGAGVFGVWTAAHLHRAGKRVAVVDATGPAHSGASSGGESRVTRCGYGDRALYTEWAGRSMAEWRALSERAALPLFHELGVLWIHRDGEAFYEANAKTLAAHDVPFERWPARELRERYPVLRVADDEAGFFEPRGGGLMARRAVQQLAAELVAAGVVFLQGKVSPIRTADGVDGAPASVTTADSKVIEAERFVFACGPWLDRACPDAMEGRLFVTRQEVVYFAADRARTGALPVWADLPFYGLPSLEGRGFKVADDTHGPAMDVDVAERRVGDATVTRAREFLSRRFPSIAESPLSETRVCQYENSSNGDFVLDRHPGLDNVWLAGCGSGHGFKHGPAVGAHLAGLVLGKEQPIARFSLDSKQIRQERDVR
ncbi:MAG: FAD-dependent oxidoreductase [Planctomycetota bacterium]|jgi:glycine/D-amino acid oxidase-like deaminating enzyme